MSDNIVNLVSNSESNASFSAGVGTSHDSHLHPFAHDRLAQKVISLSDDSNS